MAGSGTVEIEADLAECFSEKNPAVPGSKGHCPAAAWQNVSLRKIIFHNLFAFLFKLSFDKQVWQ